MMYKHLSILTRLKWFIYDAYRIINKVAQTSSEPNFHSWTCVIKALPVSKECLCRKFTTVICKLIPTNHKNESVEKRKNTSSDTVGNISTLNEAIKWFAVKDTVA